MQAANIYTNNGSWEGYERRSLFAHMDMADGSMASGRRSYVENVYDVDIERQILLKYFVMYEGKIYS